MRKTIRTKVAMFIVLVLMMVFASMVYSHCQIPCGIYGDPARFDMIAEHTTTIEKSIKQITILSKQNKPDMNQIVRWVQNKEQHADELSHIVTHYFMAQRIKPVSDTKSKAYQEYIRKLTLLHEMLIYSMKAKQTTDLSNVEKLKTLLAEFRSAYFQQDTHKH
ncbi:MAG: superoxide dismutase [Phycisphaerae bacterium]|nr:superoxide dismutase [Phycisphaerae bacterium]NIP55061.1 superoxide dismutase [Phycisphaerae bacterium]NIS53772.1 superoxide dismutase [Phycisphaerae bacterium]NIU11350.1 superoxide dismutase [Phycisphaerae bacterium]NIU57480.1 superoxide dismutase [Phycisphaerae bacterium]